MASGQTVYNDLVAATGCGSATNTLSCLQGVSFDSLITILADDFTSVVWAPFVDGTFLALNPWDAIQQGLYTQVCTDGQW